MAARRVQSIAGNNFSAPTSKVLLALVFFFGSLSQTYAGAAEDGSIAVGDKSLNDLTSKDAITHAWPATTDLEMHGAAHGRHMLQAPMKMPMKAKGKGKGKGMPGMHGAMHGMHKKGGMHGKGGGMHKKGGMPKGKGVTKKGGMRGMRGRARFTSKRFPPGFAWGTGTSAYQIEGAWNVGGKGLSIWDVFTQSGGKIFNNNTGNVACDHYNRYKEDIKLMAAMGVNSYKLSIAWSRILPDGKTVNPTGIMFYNNVINELLKYKITPYVVLYHWDLPYTVDKLGGWLSPVVMSYFATYAETCFKAYGDRVKYWITLNEPLSFCVLGYGNNAIQAPGRCSDRTKCKAGNSSTEPYICGHNALRAHFAAARIYKTIYQKPQGGKIGISCDGQWGKPLTNKTADVAAAETFRLFQLGWFLDPIFLGDYPPVMRMHLKGRLPQFSATDRAMMGPVDFVGLNHYTSRAISAGGPPADPGNSNYYADNWVGQQGIGPTAFSGWLNIYPSGLGLLISWMSKRYNNPDIYITENGVDEKNDAAKPLAEALKDPLRIAYIRDYLRSVLVAMRRGAKVKGYFVWSFMDNFEWAGGYSSRFGLYLVDYKNGLKRYPKASVAWYTSFLKE